jgi:hypothetical protein
MASLDEYRSLLGPRLRTRFDDDAPATITPGGRRRGLWGSLVGGWGAVPTSIDEVLAVDEWGDAVAWRVVVGSGEVVQLFGRDAPPASLPSALNLAEAGLRPPTVEKRP